MTEPHALVKIRCGQCGDRLAEIFDRPNGEVQFVWNNRRPSEEGSSQFRNSRTPIVRKDPSTLDPQSVLAKSTVGVHCYSHRSETNGLVALIKWIDLARDIAQARRTGKAVTILVQGETWRP